MSRLGEQQVLAIRDRLLALGVPDDDHVTKIALTAYCQGIRAQQLNQELLAELVREHNEKETAK
jgi:hypothetical protein